MREAGLVDAWRKQNQGYVWCHNLGKEKRATYSPLTLGNLAGPWIFLLVGYILALLMFFIIFFHHKVLQV